MSELFHLKEWYIHEHVGLTNLHEAYDILDRKGGKTLGSAMEQASMSCRVAKFFIDKDFLPLNLWVNDPHGGTLLSLSRPGAFFRSAIQVCDAQEQPIYLFKQPLFHLAGKLDILDPHQNPIGTVQGNIRETQYQVLGLQGESIGDIQHVAGGFFRDTFTSADDYRVQLQGDQKYAALVLAAALAIDLVFHE